MSYKTITLISIASLFITEVGFAKITQTKINPFNPTMIQNTVKHGYCWTASIATNRADAWRCMSSNNIYDPCFTIASTKNALICNADPSINTQGFLLKLTNPLPTIARSKNSSPTPLFVKLENNDICKPFTGTMPILHNGKKIIALQFGCTNNADGTSNGLVENSITKGKVWKAKQAIYSTNTNTPMLIKLKTVVIKEVWQ